MMSEDQQNIAIHVALGRCRKQDVHYVTGRGNVYVILTEHGPAERQIPNYTRDLNHMHEAESALPNDQLWYMNKFLAEIVSAKMPFSHASAKERAEAFLKTFSDCK